MKFGNNWDNSGPYNPDPHGRAPIDPFRTGRYNIMPVDQAVHRGRRPLVDAVIPVALLCLVMWVLFLLEALTGIPMSHMLGLAAQDPTSMWNIGTSWLVHLNFSHIANNSVPLLIFGTLIGREGQVRFWWVTVVGILISGLGVWLFSAPGTLTVGASGLVFSYFGYIIVAAFVEQDHTERPARISMAVVIGIYYGASMFWGLVPQSQISWQGHLFGAVGGAIAAILAESAEARRKAHLR
ncbi:MAG: rhomboid family intramembrane serine protease [Actinomycetaceae bacterium]|nr:rhomboid family intramembrane serine protease [Actinomycetaceae bacterium]